MIRTNRGHILLDFVPEVSLDSFTTHPFFRIKVEILDLAVLKERREPNAIIGDMRLLADH